MSKKILDEVHRMADISEETSRVQQLKKKFYLGTGLIKLIEDESSSNMVTLKFGKYNPRPLDNNNVLQMVKNFKDHGMRNTDASNAIPVIISKRSIDVKSLSTDRLASDYPQIHFESDITLDACSGQHRVAALQRYMDDLQKQRKGLKSRSGKGKAKRTEAETSGEIEKLDEAIDVAHWWIVDFYDQAAPEDLWTFLSTNETAHIQGQTQEEVLVRSFRTLINNPDDFDAVDLRTSRNKVHTLIVTRHAREACTAMVELEKYFISQAIFTVKWLLSAFFGVHGGILCSLITHSLRTLKAIVSTAPFLTSSEVYSKTAYFVAATAYFEAVRKGEQTDTTADAEFGILTNDRTTRAKAVDVAESRLRREIDEIQERFMGAGQYRTELLTKNLLQELDKVGEAFALSLGTFLSDENVFWQKMDDYKHDVITLVKRSIADRTIQGTAVARIAWIFAKGAWESTPLPFMTSSVIRIAHQALCDVPESIMEISRWFHPVVDYMAIRKQNLHDYSAHIFEAISLGRIVKDSGELEIDYKIARRLFISAYMDLPNMEAHLRALKDFVRPTKSQLAKIFTAHKERAKNLKVLSKTTPNWPIVIGAACGEDHIDHLFTEAGWGDISESYFSTLHHARDSVIKGTVGNLVWANHINDMDAPTNFVRDYSPWVEGAIFERYFVPTYRILLLESTAAGVVRDKIKTWMPTMTWLDGLDINCQYRNEDTGIKAAEDSKLFWAAQASIWKVMAPLYKSPYAKSEPMGDEISPIIARALSNLKAAFEVNVHQQLKRTSAEDIQRFVFRGIPEFEEAIPPKPAFSKEPSSKRPETNIPHVTTSPRPPSSQPSRNDPSPSRALSTPAPLPSSANIPEASGSKNIHARTTTPSRSSSPLSPPHETPPINQPVDREEDSNGEQPAKKRKADTSANHPSSPPAKKARQGDRRKKIAAMSAQNQRVTRSKK